MMIFSMGEHELSDGPSTTLIQLQRQTQIITVRHRIVDAFSRQPGHEGLLKEFVIHSLCDIRDAKFTSFRVSHEGTQEEIEQAQSRLLEINVGVTD